MGCVVRVTGIGYDVATLEEVLPTVNGIGWLVGCGMKLLEMKDGLSVGMRGYVACTGGGVWTKGRAQRRSWNV
jgi:hypothetical protein